ncbi:D-lyxose/D-mannose family sugar isomerase [Oceanispirochaeta crateris]|uniref:D-lyxose ketol-isomerase n=1 Tax=Oceanispirochaeta crateris TaxID=2518645 RepID=A0A5C1QP56_9SPIO|nr:D-lyxose/D-mannose family sugar isomerase [Oceanispirochaeta crateris]QEN08346.1 D-lyxose/D-mannose family sugar isomerase [Oceanispirochaeta crateris]
MTRSKINQIIKESIQFFEKMNFMLPPFAHFSKNDWVENISRYKEILDLQLGWDITDFGHDNFEEEGLLLFTLRNGRLGDSVYSKSYAEKIMIVQENQYTPMHYHWVKMEDIINRGGGNLLIKFYMADENDQFSPENIVLSIDGSETVITAGETVSLKPGESVTIPRKVFHTFWGEEGKGPVLVGEVSMVNDDSSDNNFFKAVGRFPKIEENEQPYRLIGSDYSHILAMESWS